jgi:Bacterial antitoxin of type II TA system, VapB
MPACKLTERCLIWLASRANVGRHIMKTTIEIADDLFERAQRIAQKEKTTFRSLAEEGLRLVLARKRQRKPGKLPPLVTYGGSGLTEEFKDWNWDRIRDEIYRGRGT